MKKFEPEETKSADILAENIEQLKALFPEAVIEGKIDFQVLTHLLGGMVDEKEEKYGLNWHGKRRARQLALTPSTGTLRPCPEDSVDWDTTQNLMIEGDNLEVLKLLQKSYAGKVKLIYIDPPYNTGKDFVYPDDFQDNIKNYLQLTGQVEGGKKISSNTETSGRFHTDWLNMMYPRLKLARNLLRDDGVIFISIDDGELDNLRKVSAEVFGEENFVVQIIWRKRSTPPNDKIIGANHDYIVCYAKNAMAVKLQLRERSENQIERYRNPDNHPKGPWAPGDLMANVKGGRFVKSLFFKIVNPQTGEEHFPGTNGNWRFSAETIAGLLANNEIYFGEDGGGKPKLKRFLRDVKKGVTYPSIWDFVPLNTNGSNEMNEIFGNATIFESPKPVGLVQELMKLGTSSDAIVLDFFAGSGTTGHAVFVQNLTDSGTRRFIMIQLPEATPQESEAAKAGYGCITELTKERLRRAGKNIREEYSSPQRGEVGRGAGRGAKAGSTTEDLWLPTPVPAGLLEAARNLRKNMTDAEQLLWQCLRGKQLDGYKFRKQHPIERYVLDFYCPSKKLAIELDGGQHNTEGGKAADVERTSWLNQQGIKVLRFWNHELLTNISGVIQVVWDALHDILPPPQPSPAGGGSLNHAGGGSLKLDLGFRVFKLDTTNIRAWEPDRANLSQTLLDSVEHLKGDRSELDVLYELLLKLGLDLCVPMEQKAIAGKTVHSIGAGTLLVCLAPQIGREEVEPLALGIVEWHKALAPAGESTVVFRDSAFADDVAKTNLAAILQQHGLENVRSL